MPDRRVAFGLIVLAVVVRCAAVLVLQSHTVPHSTYEHGAIAANLVAGRGFSVRFLGAEGPTSQQAPIYPAIVAVAYAIGGVETPRALLILELGQAVLGGVLVVGIMRLAAEVAPGRVWVARGASLIGALHPTLVYATTHVQVAPFAATFLTFTLAAAYRTGRTGRVRDALATGSWCGLLVLTDPILAVVVVGIVGTIGMGQRIARTLRLVAVVGATVFVIILPWTVRNYWVHGELVAVKSTFGYAFWQGNCALSEGTDKVVRTSVERALGRGKGQGLRGMNAALWDARHEAGYLDDIALTQDDYRMLAVQTEPERSRRLFSRAIDELRSDPWRYPALCLRRLRYFVFFDETNPKTRNVLYRASHLGLTLLSVVALVMAGREQRRRLWPTFVTVGLIAAFHALTIVSARFHIPIEPLMAIWCGCGLRYRRTASTAPADHIKRIGIERRLAKVA